MNEYELLNSEVKWFQRSCVATLLCHLTLAAVFSEAFCGVTWLRTSGLELDYFQHFSRADSANMIPWCSCGSVPSVHNCSGAEHKQKFVYNSLENILLCVTAIVSHTAFSGSQ